MPLFDWMAGVPLKNPPGNRLTAVALLIEDCIPGLNFLFLIAAEDSHELHSITGDWKNRVGDFEVFGSQHLRAIMNKEGITVVGMRALRDLMRVGALCLKKPDRHPSIPLLLSYT